MRNDTGQFIVIDGVAGSGKSTLIRAIKAKLEEKGLKIFDLNDWTRENDKPPKFKDIADYDVYFTFEPTKYWVGAAIRHELSYSGASGDIVAQAFSLDRHIQYVRLIAPALAAGKIIIQDRSVSSSIVYQPIMKEAPSLEDLIALPGNALALTYPPDHLILTHIDPEKLQTRLDTRDDDSKGVFENIDYLKKVDQRFRSEWFSQLFTSRGTCVHDFSTDQPKAQMEEHITKIITSILNKNYG
ncbi:deoxynucleoside kinase [Candidatus Uhrbacteria bacterium]|jgi:thymidylate kinase|nr:deoxynucleoside kinase [Candidatus Uhrbacteria bacterium]MBT7717531.1 deoxynucleoside kinase [Candidatus Uhrbacteria bacterium]